MTQGKELFAHCSDISLRSILKATSPSLQSAAAVSILKKSLILTRTFPLFMYFMHFFTTFRVCFLTTLQLALSFLHTKIIWPPID